MCQLCVTGRFQEQVGTAWKDRQFARQFFSKVLYIYRERDWALYRICARALTFENVPCVYSGLYTGYVYYTFILGTDF